MIRTFQNGREHSTTCTSPFFLIKCDAPTPRLSVEKKIVANVPCQMCFLQACKSKGFWISCSVLVDFLVYFCIPYSHCRIVSRCDLYYLRLVPALFPPSLVGIDFASLALRRYHAPIEIFAHVCMFSYISVYNRVCTASASDDD